MNLCKKHLDYLCVLIIIVLEIIKNVDAATKTNVTSSLIRPDRVASKRKS